MSGGYRYSRRRKYYSPQAKENYAMNLAKRTASVTKSAEKYLIKQSQRKGVYPENVRRFMENTASVWSLQDRVVFIEVNNMAYFGRKAYKTLLSQAYYSGSGFLPKKAVNTAVDNLMTAISAEINNNNNNNNNQNANQNTAGYLPKPSFGIVPHTDTTITFVMRTGDPTSPSLSEDFSIYLVNFILYNIAGLPAENIRNYLGQAVYNEFVNYTNSQVITSKVTCDFAANIMTNMTQRGWNTNFPNGYKSWFANPLANITPQMAAQQQYGQRNPNDNNNYDNDFLT